MGDIVSYLPDENNKFVCLSNCRYCAYRTQNLPGLAPNNAFRVLQISSKRFIFGGVIAERVNTAKSPRRVNPIGYSAAKPSFEPYNNITL